MTNQRVVNLYNPSNQTEKELLDSFVVRKDEFTQIFNDIRYSRATVPDPHLVIQGQRGQGKTPLLLKLYYETKNDEELKWRFVPIIFNEEQYNICSIFDFWENVAEELEEILDLGGLTDEMGRYARIYSGNSEEKAFEMLKLISEKYRRKLILFVDTLGDILAKFSKEDCFRFFEILMHRPEIRIIATSTFAIDFSDDISSAYKEVFRTIALKGLNRKDTIKLFLKLGKKYNVSTAKEIVEKEPGRLEALRRLTSGVPRTIVLLFEVFTSQDKGNSFRDLEIILDRVTPLYKHRMDDLPPQQQIIVNTLAMNWEAVSLKRIIERTRLEAKTAVKWLQVLERNHIVYQVDKQLYQLMDRFFNIWYLMRYGKKQGRLRVQWFVQFLEHWNTPGELEHLAKRHINSLESEKEVYDKHAFYMTEALARTNISMKLQHEMIHATKTFLNKKNEVLLQELSQSDIEKMELFVEAFEKEDYKAALECMEGVLNKNDLVFFNMGFLYMDKFQDYKNAKKCYVEASEKGHVTAMYNLALLYENKLKNYKKAEKYYLMAVARGHVKAMNNVALLYIDVFRNYANAEKYFFMAARDGDVKAVYNLALLFENHIEDMVKAEKYYLMAVKKGHKESVYNLISLYFKTATHKGGAFNLAKQLYSVDKNIRSAHLLCMTAMWNQQLELALKIAESLLARQDYVDENRNMVVQFFLMMLAKKQYKPTLKLFLENPFHLKERFKPIYYVIMVYLRQDYPAEHKKIGPEMKETVREIIQRVNIMAAEYE
ncbi:MAG: sel1 repeat family protein [bacterium]|nr:sel1 repeat family protein [bacterium]